MMTEQTRDKELASFKIDINLIDFVIEIFSYQPDQKFTSTTPRSLRLKGPADKIVIARDSDHHWIYFSVHNDRDSGSIIDFLLNRGRTFANIRRELRPWLGRFGESISLQHASPTLKSSSRATRDYLTKFETAVTAISHEYLTSRLLTEEILGDARFRETIRRDSRGNALFPHEDEQGLSGFEIKNHNFTGFAVGGSKSLWRSNSLPGDRDLVIAESAIDALSHWAVRKLPAARYISTGGGWGPDTSRLIEQLVDQLPNDGRVILAFDNDEQGHTYADTLEEIIEDSGRRIERDFPEQAGWDWNDVRRGEKPVEKKKAAEAPQRPQNEIREGSPRERH